MSGINADAARSTVEIPRRRFSIFVMLKQMHRLAVQRHHLSQLEPHMLRDIGVTAENAQKEANRPVWDAPEHWR